ncbi:sulfite exporter TauE/SafE family protein [Rhodobacteraceae bacterium CCMM004]|nr:sulfite exporter TauE/SafE family protein [Rhodobacteraceae bacterium CCMM004]
MDGWTIWAIAAAIGLLAGFVKGTVGFAMPMVMISGLGSVLSPEIALAALILPTLVSNLWQALRGGLAAAMGAAAEHWRYIGIVLVFIALSAQLVTRLPAQALFLALGIPVTLFAVLQLAGWRLRLTAQRARRRAEIVIAAVAGVIGGMTGVWGPPTVLYLTALETPKRRAMQVQGVVYGAGAVMLTLAHVQSGVLNAQTLPLSLGMLVPALAGLALGFAVQDRLDQEKFRRATLAVLVIAGLNLIRRGVLG